MIEVDTQARCKHCGRSIERIPGRRKREFCGDACRQRYHRQLRKPPARAESSEGGKRGEMELATLRAAMRKLLAFHEKQHEIKEMVRTSTRGNVKHWLRSR